MVFAREAAVVVKGRDGRTVLLQSRGLDVQQASLAASDAMARLQAASQSADAWDILSSSQGAPLLCGRIDVMHSKFAVTYRVAGALIFLCVTPPAANAFSCVQLLGQVVRVVLAPSEGKAVEATPERLQRRFGEVYLAVDALLGSGGVLEANGALARAAVTLEQLHDKGGKGGDKTAAAAEGPKTPPKQPASTKRTTRRTLQGAIDQLARLSFTGAAAIMQAVPPRPGFQLPDAAAAAAAAAASAAAARGGVPGAPAAAAAAASGFGDDDMFDFKKGAAKPALPPGADPNDPFAMSDAIAAKAADDWQSFSKEDGPAAAAAAGAAKKDLGFEDDAFGGPSGFTDSAFPASAPQLPVPSEPVLRLTEAWRGEVAGGRLVRAGLAGRVEWASEAAKSKVHTVQFMVQPPEPANEHLAAALTSAHRHPACCKPAPGRAGGVLLADGIAAKPHVGAPLLAYHLPPVACRQPLQAHLGASVQSMGDGRRLVTLGLHLAVNPRLAAGCAGITVELSLPALLEAPLRAAPVGAVFDGKARLLRWEVGGPALAAGLDNDGGAAEPFVACFVVEAAGGGGGGGGGDVEKEREVALQAALAERLGAKLVLRGGEGGGGGGGGSLSGAGLAQGVVELESTPALCSWRADLSLVL